MIEGAVAVWQRKVDQATGEAGGGACFLGR
jgi:hypothetical protein